jgi:hypothetical protein
MRKVFLYTLISVLMMVSSCGLFYPPQFYTDIVNSGTGNSNTGSSIPSSSSSSSFSANLALNQPVYVSDTEATNTIAAYAVDGDYGSRWCSLPNYPAWIYVDLGSNYTITNVILYWEACASNTFYIEGSSNASIWSNIATGTGLANFDTNTLPIIPPAAYRYIRMTANGSLGTGGVSLYEFEVYGY